MKYSLGVSSLLAASVAAIYVDTDAGSIYHIRDLQTDSHIQARDIHDLFTTVLRRSPQGGGPGRSSGGIARAQSPSNPSPKSSPSGSPRGSPSRGASSSRSGASSPGSGPSPPESPRNPFTSAAQTPFTSTSTKPFSKPTVRIEGTGTLVPQSRHKKPMIKRTTSPAKPDRTGFRASIGRVPFGVSSQSPASSGGRGQNSSGRGGRAQIGIDRSQIALAQLALDRTRTASRASPGTGMSTGKAGTGSREQGSSGREGKSSPGLERRSVEDEEIPIHHTRAMDDWHTNDIYIRSLTDVGSLWERDLAGDGVLLQARAPPLKVPKITNNNGNPTGIRTSGGGTAATKGNNEAPSHSRGSSPIAESPRHTQPIVPPPSRSPGSQAGNTPSGHASQSSGIRSGWPITVTPPRSILRHGSAGSGRGQHVKFASPIETQILVPRPDFSSTDSLESLDSKL